MVMRALLLAGCCALAWAVAGNGESGFDPLRRVEDEEMSAFRWELAGSYTPHGTEGATFDVYGQPYRFVRFVDERSISLSASITIGNSHKLGINVTDTATTLRERRDFATGSVQLEARDTAASYSGYYEVRVAPRHTLDPRFRLTHAVPAGLGTAASISLLLDPVILLGGLALSHHDDPPGSWLTATAAGGLVANQRVSYAVKASLAVPVDAVALPSASLGYRSVVALDARQTREVVIAVTVSLRGDRTWLAGTIALRGRGL